MQVVGCRSLCKALDQGWLAYYIAQVKGQCCNTTSILVVVIIINSSKRWSQPQAQQQGEDDAEAEMTRLYMMVGLVVAGARSIVDPILVRPDGQRIRWSDQFLQGGGNESLANLGDGA